MNSYLKVVCIIDLLKNKSFNNIINPANCKLSMSSTDLLKRRLTSLKSLTQEIKNSTTDMPIDIGHLKQLLE